MQVLLMILFAWFVLSVPVSLIVGRYLANANRPHRPVVLRPQFRTITRTHVHA